MSKVVQNFYHELNQFNKTQDGRTQEESKRTAYIREEAVTLEIIDTIFI